jgi:hypothetical protein
MVKIKLAAAASGAALVLSLAGCGESSSDKLNAWAKTVCDQASVQVKKINAANLAIADVNSAGKPSDVKNADSAAFQQISDAYKSLAAIVGTAGDPAVQDGTKLKTEAVNDLNRLSTSYSDLKKQVDGLDTADQGKFADGLNSVSESLGTVSKTGGQALDSLRQGDVGAAMAKQSGCRSAGAPASAS